MLSEFPGSEKIWEFLLLNWGSTPEEERMKTRKIMNAVRDLESCRFNTDNSKKRASKAAKKAARKAARQMADSEIQEQTEIR